MSTTTTAHSKGLTWSLSSFATPSRLPSAAPVSSLDLIRDKLSSFVEKITPIEETLPPTPPPTIMPSSILDAMVARYIQHGIDIRPAPTASPFPTTSPHPTITGSPTASRTPTSSRSPSKSPSPSIATISPSVSPVVSHFSSEPFPADTLSHYPIEVKNDPIPTLQPQELVTTYNTQGKIPTSLGYGHRCTNLEMSADSAQVEVVFTYLAESTILSPTFLRELEVHLLDHAASEALQCTSDKAFYIYEIKYPENKAASEIVTCQPSHPESNACWILRTTMLVTTDQFSKASARHVVLSDLKAELNDEKLLNEGFEDISFSQYVGPDLMEIFIPKITGGEHGYHSQNDSFLYYALIAAGTSAFLITLLLGCYICKRRRQAKNVGGKLTSTGDASNEYDSDGSIEIQELLSKTRKRIHKYKDKPQQESWDSESSPADEKSTCSSEYQHSQKSEESSKSARKTGSMASQDTRKSRKASSSDRTPREGKPSSKEKSEKQRQREDIERCDVSRKDIRASKSSRRNKQ